MSDLFYLDLNSTSPKVAVLIHGLGANSNMWQFQWRELEQAGFRIIVPDMRGFGNTPYSQPNTAASMAADVLALLDELGIPKANIIGLSMGGAIAMQFALNYPERVDKLVLANTAAKFANKFGGALYTALRYALLKIIPRHVGAEMTAKYLFPNPNHGAYRKEFVNEIMQVSEKAFMETIKGLILHNLKKQVHNISAPTLILGSKKDLVTPPFQQKFLEKTIPNSKLVIFENSGHVSAVDNHEEFNRVLLDFLSSL